MTQSLGTGYCTLLSVCTQYSCLKILLYSGGCDARTYHDKCFSQLKGNGLCIDKACQCSYFCKPPPLDSRAGSRDDVEIGISSKYQS